MTISTEPTQLTYSGDDLTVAFPITWNYFAKSHVVATLRNSSGAETVWVLDTDYTLTDADLGSGTLTATTAPATSETLVIDLDPPNTQEKSLPVGSSIPTAQIEAGLDLAAQRDAKLEALFNRALRVPVSDTQTGSLLELPIDSLRASKALHFDSAGKPSLVTPTDASGTNVTSTSGVTSRSLASRADDLFNVKDHGAAGDGVTDDTAAIQLAIDTAAGQAEIWFPAGTYLVSDEITIDKHRTNLRGAGQRATIIDFQPTASGKSAFHFTWTSPYVLVQCSCKGFGFSSVGNTQDTKAAIRTTAAEEIIIDDIAVASLSSTGKDCIGFRSNGFQNITLSNATIQADIPIQLKDNPNGTIDVDHYHFYNLYLLPDSTQPNIVIDSGVNVNNLTFDGYQAWVGGTDGLYWVDTATTQIGQQVSINNVRWENGTDPAGYLFHIDHNYNLLGLRIENCSGGAGSLGIKIRSAVNVTLANVITLNTTGTALDVDNTVQPLILDNVFFQASGTVSVGTLKTIYDSGVGLIGGTSGAFVIYANPTVTNQAVSGIPIHGPAVSIAQDATAVIGPTTNGPVGTVFISTDEDNFAQYSLHGASGTVSEISDPGSVFTVTKDTASSYNIYAESGNYLIQNKRTGTHTVRWYVIGANI